jgi:hypothetical protein
METSEQRNRLESGPGGFQAKSTRHRNVFQPEGEYWTISYEGVLFRVRDLKGLRCLARLLAQPGEKISAVDLLLIEQGQEYAGSAEKARVAVAKRIRTAINRIAGYHPSLAYHLSTAVKTGAHCVYLCDPAKPTSWLL